MDPLQQIVDACKERNVTLDGAPVTAENVGEMFKRMLVMLDQNNVLKKRAVVLAAALKEVL